MVQDSSNFDYMRSSTKIAVYDKDAVCLCMGKNGMFLVAKKKNLSGEVFFYGPNSYKYTRCFGFQFLNDLYKILGKGEGGKGLRDNLKRRKKINDNLLIVFFLLKI